MSPEPIGGILLETRKRIKKLWEGQFGPDLSKLTEPQDFTAAQANTYGWYREPLRDDVTVRIIPDKTRQKGFRSLLRYPDNWELTDEDIFVSPEGKAFTRAEIVARNEAIKAEQTAQARAFDIQYPEKDFERMGPKDVEAAFTEMEGAAPSTWMPAPQPEDIVKPVFPERSRASVIAYARDYPQIFINDIREKGRGPEIEALLKDLFRLEDADIDQIFQEPKKPPTQIPAEGALAQLTMHDGSKVDVKIMPDNTVWEGDKQIGTYDEKTGKLTAMKPGEVEPDIPPEGVSVDFTRPDGTVISMIVKANGTVWDGDKKMGTLDFKTGVFKPEVTPRQPGPIYDDRGNVIGQYYGPQGKYEGPTIRALSPEDKLMARRIFTGTPNIWDTLAFMYSPSKFNEARQYGMTGGEFFTAEMNKPGTLLNAALMDLPPTSGLVKIPKAAFEAGARASQAAAEARAMVGGPVGRLAEALQTGLDIPRGIKYTVEDVAGAIAKFVKQQPQLAARIPAPGMTIKDVSGKEYKFQIAESARVPIAKIDILPKKYQYRLGGVEGLDPERVKQIVDDFRPQLFDPIQVRKVGDRFELLSGYHRIEAWKQLEKKGSVSGEIPVLIHNVPEEVGKEIARLGNMNVKPYSPVEKINVFKDAFAARSNMAPDEAIKDIAQKYGGVKTSFVRNNLDAALLPTDVLGLLDNPAVGNAFTIEHAAVLARAMSKYNYEPAGLMAVAQKLIIEEGMTPGRLEIAMRTVGEKVQQAGMFAGQMFDFTTRGGILSDIAKVEQDIKQLNSQRNAFNRFSKIVTEANQKKQELPKSFYEAQLDTARVVRQLEQDIKARQLSIGQKVKQSVSPAKVEIPVPAQPEPAGGPLMAPGTSVQTGLPSMGPAGAQSKMFGEVRSADLAPSPLLDAEALKAKQAAKALPGQGAMPEGVLPKVEVKPPVTEVPQAAGVLEAAGQPPPPPVKIPPEPKPAEPPPIGRRRTLDEANATIGTAAKVFFGKESEELNQATLQMFRAQRAKHAAEYSEQVELLRNDPALRNLSADEIENRAREAMKGRLKRPEATLSKYITEDVGDAMFDKVFHTLHNLDTFEELSTNEALRNALMGKGIPRKRGTGTKMFPEGGSSYERLKVLFADQPELLEELEKGKSLNQIVQEKLAKGGPFKEWEDFTVPPEYPRRQPTLFGGGEKQKGFEELPGPTPEVSPELTLAGQKAKQLPSEVQIPPPTKPFVRKPETERLLDYQEFATRLANSPEGISAWQEIPETPLLRPLQEQGQFFPEPPIPPPSSPLTRKLTIEEQNAVREMIDSVGFATQRDKLQAIQDIEDLVRQKGTDAAKRRIGLTFGPRYEPPIQKAIDQPSLMPRNAKVDVGGILKELGMTGLDIGNAIRTMVASADNSWWRQAAPLILNHKNNFVKANVDSWGAVFSQKRADAAWQAIVKSPLYHIYDKIGADFLRPLEVMKGERFKGVEELGFLTKERPIPNFMSKLPNVKLSFRGFTTGINSHTWRIFEEFYEKQLELSRRMATGKIPTPPEGFNIEKNLKGMATLLEDLGGRARLGKATVIAPAVSAVAFAPRLAAGRILSPRHLISANRFVRKEAWQDLAWTVGFTGSFIMAGKELGAWDTETDPRSPLSARIRIGNTVIDPWGGYQKYVRFVAQAVTKSGLSSTTGAQYETSPKETTVRLLQGMASPIASLLIDFTEGKNFIGEPIDIKRPRQWMERLAPMIVTDIYDAFTKSGPIIGAAITPLSVMGIGVQSYEMIIQKVAKQWQTELKQYTAIPSDPLEVKAAKEKDENFLSRTEWRKEKPNNDAKLFITGQVGSLASEEAIDAAVKIIRDNQIDPTTIKAISNRQEKLAKAKELGLEPGKDTFLDSLLKDLGLYGGEAKAAGPEAEGEEPLPVEVPGSENRRKARAFQGLSDAQKDMMLWADPGFHEYALKTKNEKGEPLTNKSRAVLEIQMEAEGAKKKLDSLQAEYFKLKNKPDQYEYILTHPELKGVKDIKEVPAGLTIELAREWRQYLKLPGGNKRREFDAAHPEFANWRLKKEGKEPLGKEITPENLRLEKAYRALKGEANKDRFLHANPEWHESYGEKHVADIKSRAVLESQMEAKAAKAKKELMWKDYLQLPPGDQRLRWQIAHEDDMGELFREKNVAPVRQRDRERLAALTPTIEKTLVKFNMAKTKEERDNIRYEHPDTDAYLVQYGGVNKRGLPELPPKAYRDFVKLPVWGTARQRRLLKDRELYGFMVKEKKMRPFPEALTIEALDLYEHQYLKAKTTVARRALRIKFKALDNYLVDVKGYMRISKARPARFGRR